MSCNDYQQYIQQWFNYVLDAHVARCESCTTFFLQLSQTTATDLARLQAASQVASHAAAELASAAPGRAQPGSAAPYAVPSAAPATNTIENSQAVAPVHDSVPSGLASQGPGEQGGQLTEAKTGQGKTAKPQPVYNQAGIIQPGPAQNPAAGQGQVQGQAQQAQAQGQGEAVPGQPDSMQSGARPVHQTASPQQAVQVQFSRQPRIPLEDAMPRLAPHEGIDNTTVGRLFEIGKFILSDEDREILKRMTGDEPPRPGVKILSHRDSESLQAVLGQVSRLNSVVGWVIISNDGLLIYSTLPEHFDAENIAVRGLSIYMGSEESVEKFGFPGLRQVVMRTAIGTLIISNFSGGLFITVATGNDADSTVELIQQIRAVT
jgi:predicted regulator of Ras-like GTPase activity (Roadblock/LC7/MglB family)